MRMLSRGCGFVRRHASRLIYTWDYGYTKGFSLWRIADFYATNKPTWEVGPRFGIDFGRLHVSWRRDA